MELRQGTMRFAGGELRVVDGGDGSGGHVVAVRPEDDIGDFDGGRARYGVSVAEGCGARSSRGSFGRCVL